MKKAKSIKKPARALITLILALLIAVVNVPLAATAAVDDCFFDGNLLFYVTYEYENSSSGFVTVGFNEDRDPSNVTAITIPEKIVHDGRTYYVTAIADYAFSSCTALESIDLSKCKGLDKIGMGAFVDCESLKTITIKCDFDKTLFQDTGVVPSGDKFTIEYGFNVLTADPPALAQTPTGTFKYVHNWIMDEPDSHYCINCQKTEAHYGGTATCEKGPICEACGGEYGVPLINKHNWQVEPETIGATTAAYECAVCRKEEVKRFDSSANSIKYNGQNLSFILQDPYKVLADGTKLSGKLITPASARYGELYSQLDNTLKNKIENIAFFELDLVNGRGENINGEIPGNVRILMQIPDGWDKDDLQAVLVMAGTDVEFEESVITIDGIDYLALWTNHFSPYAMIDTVSASDKTSPATGNQEIELLSAIIAASFSAIMIIYLASNKKRKSY